MPLAEYLAPLILRKANELEATLGPPGPQPKPMQQGYLQAGFEKTPYDPRGILDKKGGGRSFDPNSPAGKEMVVMGNLQRSENPYTRGFANSYLVKRGSMYPAPEPLPTSPAAPMKLVKKGDKTGTKGRVLKLDPNAAVGVDERTGQSTTVKGKKLGYLAQPELVTPSGSTALRNPNRTGRDVMAVDKDKLADQEIEKRFGKHLDAMEANRDSQGYATDKFPDGYFDGASAKEKAAVIDGVEKLRQRRRLAENGIST